MDQGEQPIRGLDAADAARAEVEAADEAEAAFGDARSAPREPAASGLAERPVCPFLIRQEGDETSPPLERVDPRHRCGALAPPVEVSQQQQALVCLVAAHAACPRYLRGERIVPSMVPSGGRGRLPRTTLAAAAVLAASVLVTLAYTASRGGLAVPILASPSATAPASAAAITSPAPVTPSPSARPSPPALASPSTVPSSPPASSPKPNPSVRPSPPSPTSDRYALLVPCPDRPACYIYTVRAGDNLTSIGLYFGIPFDTVLLLNPWIRDPTTIHAGDRIVLPPPTR